MEADKDVEGAAACAPQTDDTAELDNPPPPPGDEPEARVFSGFAGPEEFPAEAIESCVLDCWRVSWLPPTDKLTGVIATFTGSVRGSTRCAKRARLRSSERTAAMQVFNMGLSTDDSRGFIANFLLPKVSAGPLVRLE
jgi:hypothetical protein